MHLTTFQLETPVRDVSLRAIHHAAVAVLEERDPRRLPMRRRRAALLLGTVAPATLARLYAPGLAAAILDTIRFSDQPTSNVDTRSRTETRGALVRAASRAGEVHSVGCLIAEGSEWHAISVTCTTAPTSRIRPLAVLLDHGRQRTDAFSGAVQQIIEKILPASDSIFIVRSRFGPIKTRMNESIEFGLAAALMAARHKQSAVMSRWATIAPGTEEHASPADLRALPPDVRIALVVEGARDPIGLEAWQVFPNNAAGVAAAVVNHRRGALVAFRVSAVSDLVATVLPFERVV